jgi:hypothetical protein
MDAIHMIFMISLHPINQKNPISNKKIPKNFAVSEIIPTFAKNNKEKMRFNKNYLGAIGKILRSIDRSLSVNN